MDLDDDESATSVRLTTVDSIGELHRCLQSQSPHFPLSRRPIHPQCSKSLLSRAQLGDSPFRFGTLFVSLGALRTVKCAASAGALAFLWRSTILQINGWRSAVNKII